MTLPPRRPARHADLIDPPHRLRPMVGRDPEEGGRAATPLELLFDLTFAVAFSAAGNEFAHALADGHLVGGVAAFCLSVLAVCWCWINFTWFASAYDTDDWLFRALTMVQMAGVIVVAVGLPTLFASIVEGDHLALAVPVAGYVVMRVAMVLLWLRAAKHDPQRRRSANAHIVAILAAQLLWCLLALADLPVMPGMAILLVPIGVEMVGPYLAETRDGGTPWHPHHIAERYGLLVIITLGETVIGTVSAMSALVHHTDAGWTADAIVVLAAGVALTFGLWWTYFVIPWGEVLQHHRERAFFWGYGHMAIFGGIAATGAGLHVGQYYLEHETHLSAIATLLAVVVPVAVYLGMLYLMYAVGMRAADRFQLLLIVPTAAALVLAVALVASGASYPVGLAIVALAPIITIVGHETIGHRHVSAHLDRLRD